MRMYEAVKLLKCSLTKQTSNGENNRAVLRGRVLQGSNKATYSLTRDNRALYVMYKGHSDDVFMYYVVHKTLYCEILCHSEERKMQ